MHEAHGPGGAFLIRSEPWNKRYDSFDLLAVLVRGIERDHRWRVRVRPFFDDPFGAAIVDEYVSSRGEVPGAIATLTDQIRAGTPPFDAVAPPS